MNKVEKKIWWLWIPFFGGVGLVIKSFGMKNTDELLEKVGTSPWTILSWLVTQLFAYILVIVQIGKIFVKH